jgi:transposase
MEDNLERKKVEGLLFGFRHFYGTYDYVGDSRKWYRKEIRVIRNDKTIRSYRDAQGFRKNGRKLQVAEVNAEMYHYGWVRHPKTMLEKIDAVKKYYQGISEEEIRKKLGQEIFDYSSRYDALARFTGTHPAVMEGRISRLNWPMEVDLKKIHMKARYQLLYRIEKWFGVRLFEYRNYRLLKGKGKG